MIRFLTGLASGLAIAYLTAPGSGKQTRTTLVNFANDEVEGIQLITKAISQVDKTVDHLTSQAGILADETKHDLDQAGNPLTAL